LRYRRTMTIADNRLPDAARAALEATISNFGKSRTGTALGQWNEGVGEHVRTKSHLKALGELRETAEPEGLRTERRKPVSSAGPVFGSEAPRNDPAVDLMSRRHPLSPVCADRLCPKPDFGGQEASTGSVPVRRSF
jgi:hypothetical protein